MAVPGSGACLPTVDYSVRAMNHWWPASYNRPRLHEYDLIAEWYASQRTDATGAPELTALLAALPRPASVLDVGCGNGLPLTRLLIDHGCQVVGVDSSPNMLAATSRRTFRMCPRFARRFKTAI